MIDPFMAREAIASVSLSHPVNCDCDVCKAGKGDEEVMDRLIRAFAQEERRKHLRDVQVGEPKAEWTNAAGEKVDLDAIDLDYALNILIHAAQNGRWLVFDAETDPLLIKLRARLLER